MSFTLGEALSPLFAGLGVEFLDAKFSGCILVIIGTLSLVLYLVFRPTPAHTKHLQLISLQESF